MADEIDRIAAWLTPVAGYVTARNAATGTSPRLPLSVIDPVMLTVCRNLERVWAKNQRLDAMLEEVLSWAGNETHEGQPTREWLEERFELLPPPTPTPQ